MVKLTAAQRRVLEVCVEVGGLHRYRQDLWNWYRRHQMGAISKVAGNSTIEVLKGLGFVQDVGFDNIAPTPAGRAALAEGGAK
ncbi:hypothetical protein AB8A05_03970 [Tardiphaga sp. 538_B7_N1_4]|jgi:hypothetical protein|uniref:hypothetical protein n=1 Tax=Tardiphaga sp. 538_B7_N1_4 TaxID=3240778 RepID=UPI003F27E5CC